MKNPLANRTGLAFVLGHLIGSGAMCPDCVHGTRVVTRKWAECKKCGRRIERPQKQKAQRVIRRLPAKGGDR